MLCAILKKSWKQHPIKQQLYGHLPPISQTIQVRWTRHAEHYWGSKDKIISGVSPVESYTQIHQCWLTSKGYIHQLCADTGCHLKDLPSTMADRDGWRETETVKGIHVICMHWWWWWWWWYHFWNMLFVKLFLLFLLSFFMMDFSFENKQAASLSLNLKRRNRGKTWIVFVSPNICRLKTVECSTCFFFVCFFLKSKLNTQQFNKKKRHNTVCLLLLYTWKNKNNNADIFKYDWLFCSFFFIAQNVHMGRVRMNQRWGWNALAHTLGQWCSFSVKSLCFSASFHWVKIFPGLSNFPDAHAILAVAPPAYVLHMDMPPV